MSRTIDLPYQRGSRAISPRRALALTVVLLWVLNCGQEPAPSTEAAGPVAGEPVESTAVPSAIAPVSSGHAWPLY